MAFHEAKEAHKRERESNQSARTNSGEGSWVEQQIGDDDEVDWKEASLLEPEEEE